MGTPPFTDMEIMPELPELRARRRALDSSGAHPYCRIENVSASSGSARGACRSGIGLAWNRRRQSGAIRRTQRLALLRRALSVAMPVLAYICRYSFEINTNANRDFIAFTQR